MSADRLQQQQFNMLQSFNPSLLQHQMAQQPQQPQQPLDGQPRQPQTFPHPDAARLWQQMQHMNGQQFRPQNAGDTQISPSNQQMADMMRNQNAVRTQQAMQGQPQNIPFGINASTLAGQNQFGAQTNGMGSQPHLNANLSSGINMMNRNAMMQAANMRQLELLQTQNGFNRLSAQQPQHTQPGMNPQPGQAQPTQNDLFTSPAMANAEAMRASPAHPQPNAAATMLGQQQMRQRDLLERIRQNRDSVAACKNQMEALKTNRGGMSEAVLQAKMTGIKNELQNREETGRKLIAVYQQLSGAGPSMMSMTGGQPGATAPAATQPAWMNPQPGIANRQHFTNNGVMGPVSASPPNVQPSPSQVPAQTTPMMSSAGIPPRTGPTPLQNQPQLIQNQFSGQHVSNPAQADSSQLTSGQQLQRAMMQMGPPPPMEKSKFDEMFVNFCRKSNLQVDNNMLSISGRTFDLHELHKAVMEAGGVNKVATQDLWPVVGARLGFVNFPGSETEPARAGPVIAQRLQHVYKEYLFQFDRSYISYCMESRRKLAEHQKQTPVMGTNPTLSGLNRMQMQATMMYAHLPAAQLRQQGVPEPTIQFVETHRSLLQRYQADQTNFREQLKMQQQPQQHPQQPQQPQLPQAQPPVATNPEVERTPSAGPSAMPQNQAGNMYPPFARAPGQGPNMMVPGAGQQIPGKSFLLANQQERAEMVAASNQAIQRIKDVIMANHPGTLNNYSVAPEQQMQFNAQIEVMHRLATDLDSKLAIVALLGVQEDRVKQLLSLITLVYQQRAGLSTNPPRYIISLENLLQVRMHLQRAKEFFDRSLAQQQQQQQALLQQQQQQQQQQLHQQHQQQAAAAQSLMNAQANLQRPPSAAPSVTSPQPEALLHNRPPIGLQPPPPAKNKLPASSPASHPTPPTNAHTPIASASSPAHPEPSSHSTPKSPKPKAAAKRAPAVVKRRPSKAQPPAPVIKSEMSEGSPSSLKRQREEEPTPLIANTPSPKRPKTEEQPSSVAGPSTIIEPEPTIKMEEVENMKNEEQATEFLQNLTDLLERAGELNESNLNADISEKLDDILRNVPPAGDSIFRSFADVGEASTFSTGGNQREPISDEFIDYFDFSSFPLDEDDAGSKAATPDLVSSSSTNTSPDSSSDSDAAHGHVGNAAVGDDFLRLGFWKDIDGGESAYYTGTQGEWDWSKPMPTKDQPWPIST